MLDRINKADEAGRLSALQRSGLLDEGTDEVFRPVASLLRTVFDVPIAFISTIGASRQRYKCSIGLDIAELPRETSFCNTVIEKADIVVIENAETDPRFHDHPLVVGPMAIRSYLGAPLISPDGYPIGTICTVSREPRRIGERDVSIIRQFADVVTEQTELLQIAERDTLTGAWTRRAFLRAAEKEMARARRHGEDAAIALFDLDHFKRINDGFGHRTGDAVLTTAVSACEARMREEDTLGRLGGEEFAVLLTGADTSAAIAAAERLRKGIEAARVLAAPHLHFTASFGVASLDGDMARAEDWIEAADRALYRAKAAGRNRVEAEPG